MKVTRFDPTIDLIIVTARVAGPRMERQVSLAFDTAATETHIIPDVVDELGYSPRDGEQVTVVRSAIGSERGYMMRVAHFAALGFANHDFRDSHSRSSRRARDRWLVRALVLAPV
ncbi:MAG TPA: aspartyl protease family protein [Kofleriaceae bacterium]